MTATLTLLCPGALATGALHGKPSLAQSWPPGWRHARLISQAIDASLVARELPHERWLRTSFAIADTDDIDAYGAASDGVAPPALRLTPVHLHTGRDHLVLTDPRRLSLTPTDAASLAGSIAALLAEDGLTLHLPDPMRWYLTGDPLPVAPARGWRLAVGRSIDAYLSRDPASRPWRRLLNEIQMTWHDHPVNRTRAAAGLPAVNSLWLEGRLSHPALSGAMAGRVFVAADPAVRGLAVLTGAPLAPLDLQPDALAQWLSQASRAAVDTTAQTDGRGAVEVILMTDFWDVTGMQGSARQWQDDWTRFGEWLRRLGADRRPPAGFGRLRVVLTGERTCVELSIERADRWRIWRTPDPDAWLERPSAEPAGT